MFSEIFNRIANFNGGLFKITVSFVFRKVKILPILISFELKYSTKATDNYFIS